VISSRRGAPFTACCLAGLLAATAASAVNPAASLTELWLREWDGVEAAMAHVRDGLGLSVRSVAMIKPTDRDPLDVAIRRVDALFAHLSLLSDGPDLKEVAEPLQNIRTAVRKTPAQDAEGRRTVFLRLCRLRRKLALRNPLLDFDSLLVTTGDPPCGSVQLHHLGVWRGQMLVVRDIKSDKPRVHDRLANATIQQGRYKGRKLRSGSCNTVDLSYDGRQIVFDWASRTAPPFGERSSYNESRFHPDHSYHLFRANLDGSDMVQLTDGRHNDSHPCWLPNGRIAFTSDRRKSTVRCNPSAKPWLQVCSVLYSCKADGTDLIPLSYHETNEVFPRVGNDGMLVYTRWDYIDREFHSGHTLWTCTPDGRDPRSPHGNYPLPHCTQDADSPLRDPKTGKFPDGRPDAPWAEFGIRPIPDSHKFVALASIHHAGPIGQVIVIDPRVRDDHRRSQVTPITCTRFPNEANGVRGMGSWDVMPYLWPWPLSGDFYLVVNRMTRALVLLDRWGNEVSLFLGEQGRPPHFAVPIKPRPRPAVIPTQTFQGERAGAPQHKRAVISVANVYNSDFDWPTGTVIKSLRVVQIFPMPWTSPESGNPPVGYGGGSIARMSLGTVPVESDGSAYFEAPIECEIYFQALDAAGLAVQSMRSGTYVHAGEHLSCGGCHESKWRSNVLANRAPLAMRRAPSSMQPETGALEPVNYYRLVKPVLDAKCIPCHKKTDSRLKRSDYRAMGGYAFHLNASGTDPTIPFRGGTRSTAGKFGARQSRLGKALLGPAHQKRLAEGRFSADDVKRILLWLDLNSLQYGSYSPREEDVEKQKAGQIFWPALDFDPSNPQRIERDRPTRGPAGAHSRNGS